MNDQIIMIDANNISVISSNTAIYNVDVLISQANNIVQNILILQSQLSDVNKLIAGAQAAGIVIDPSILINQSVALPNGQALT